MTRRIFETRQFFTSPRVKSFVFAKRTTRFVNRVERPTATTQGRSRLQIYRIRKRIARGTTKKRGHGRSTLKKKEKEKKVTPFFGKSGIRPWDFLDTFEWNSGDRWNEVDICKSVDLNREYVLRVYFFFFLFFFFFFLHHVHHQLQKARISIYYIYVYSNGNVTWETEKKVDDSFNGDRCSFIFIAMNENSVSCRFDRPTVPLDSRVRFSRKKKVQS